MTAKKILIIDDEADFVTAIRVRLEARGYIVAAAKNGSG